MLLPVANRCKMSEGKLKRNTPVKARETERERKKDALICEKKKDDSSNYASLNICRAKTDTQTERKTDDWEAA